jgi:hypothetical protein
MTLLQNKGYLSKGVALFSGTVSQNSVGNGTVINAFQSATFNSASTISRTSNTVVTLQAGRTYKLSAALSFANLSANTVYLTINFFNNTASAAIGLPAIIQIAFGTTYNVPQTCATAYITPAGPTSISLKVMDATGTGQFFAQASSVTVEEP